MRISLGWNRRPLRPPIAPNPFLYSIPDKLEVQTDLNIAPADPAERAIWDQICEHCRVVPPIRPCTFDELIGVIRPIDPDLGLVGPSDRSEGGAERGGVFERTCRYSVLECSR